MVQTGGGDGLMLQCYLEVEEEEVVVAWVVVMASWCSCYLEVDRVKEPLGQGLGVRVLVVLDPLLHPVLDQCLLDRVLRAGRTAAASVDGARTQNTEHRTFPAQESLASPSSTRAPSPSWHPLVHSRPYPGGCKLFPRL